MAVIKIKNQFSFLEELYQWYIKDRSDFFIPIFLNLDEASKKFTLYKAFNEGINENINDELANQGYSNLILEVITAKRKDLEEERKNLKKNLDKKSNDWDEFEEKFDNFETSTKKLEQILRLDLEYFRLKFKETK